MRGSMATRNVKLVPFSADDKSLLLRKLQESIYFERTLRDSAAPGHGKQYSKLTIPAGFVRKHGHKIHRSSALLRTEASTKPWPVKLTISHHSPTCAQVRFAGGWKAFAVSNGLLEGDMLVFVMTAMSEFKVYIFRSSEGPSREHRRQTGDSDDLQMKAKRPFRKRSLDACLRADEEGSSDEGKNGGKKCTRTSSSSAVYDSATAPLPSILRKRHCASPSELLETLTVSNVSRKAGATLELAEDFGNSDVGTGRGLHSAVKLQGISEQSPARANNDLPRQPGNQILHFLRGEWRHVWLSLLRVLFK